MIYQAQALLFNMDKELFVAWFVDQVKDIGGTKEKYASDCFDGIKEWVDTNM